MARSTYYWDSGRPRPQRAAGRARPSATAFSRFALSAGGDAHDPSKVVSGYPYPGSMSAMVWL
jgi:hypothetical protein